MSNTDDDERVRVLNEMRAYGKAAPFAHVAAGQSAPQKRENVYDAAMREWTSSKTFKWTIGITCVLPFVLICLYSTFVIGSVAAVGAVILRDIQRLMGGY